MNLKHRNESGSAVLIVLVAIVAALAIGTAVWIYQQHKKGTSNSNTGTKTQQNTDVYLYIKELGVKFKLTDPIKDAYYRVKDSTKNGKPVIALYLHSLDAYPNCSPAKDPDGFAAVMTFTPGAQDPVNGDLESAYPGAPLINGLHYFIAPAQYDCTGGATNIASMRDAFSAAYKTIVAD